MNYSTVDLIEDYQASHEVLIKALQSMGIYSQFSYDFFNYLCEETNVVEMIEKRLDNYFEMCKIFTEDGEPYSGEVHWLEEEVTDLNYFDSPLDNTTVVVAYSDYREELFDKYLEPYQGEIDGCL